MSVEHRGVGQQPAEEHDRSISASSSVFHGHREFALIFYVCTRRINLFLFFFNPPETETTTQNDEKSIENMRLAVQRVAVEKRDGNQPFFACLFCGGASQCQSLRSAGLNALCVSWDRNFERPKLMKIVSVLDGLILKSATLTSAVVVCSELVMTSQEQLASMYGL